MRVWPSSWNWRIVLAATLLGGVSGSCIGARRSAALLHSGELPVNSAEVFVASTSDGAVYTLLYGVLGASVALTILAPPLVVATLFQAREMAVEARLKSYNSLQQAFPGASSSSGAGTSAGPGSPEPVSRKGRST